MSIAFEHEASSSAEQLVRAESREVRDVPDLLSCDKVRELLERERARTDRTGTPFSLVLFGSNAQDSLPVPFATLARAIRQRARATDDVGCFYGPFLCAVLPGTSPAGGWQFATGVAASLGLNPSEVICGIYSYPSTLDSQVQAGTKLEAEVRQHLGMPSAGRNGRGGGGGAAAAWGEPGLGAATAAQLLPAVMAGVAAGLNPPSPVNGPLQLLFVPPVPLWKRCLDTALAGLLLICLAPVLAAVAVAIRLTSRGPVIFRQVRAGRAGRPFVLYKFRSMTVGAEAQQKALRTRNEQDGPAFKMKSDPRVTPLGRFLRKTSLDELPQLWNVLKGEMSLVGPRPLPWPEACACAPWQRRRLDVTPGITCVWQVKGRSRVSFAEWMRMDLGYVRSRRLLLDLWLLLATVPAVLFRRGAS